MIGYTTLGTNNISVSAKFYDALLAELGAKRILESDKFIIWSVGAGHAEFAIAQPYNGEAATIGNGVMVALSAKNRAHVDALYKKALELGAKDEGAAGLRGGDFYAGYVRDPDGNKINFYTLTPEK